MIHTSLLPRSTPEAQGIPSAAIGAFVHAVERELDAVHSFMLLRHGHVVAEGWWEPYRPQDRHMFFSLSKSFTSTAIGLLVAEGRLTVDDPVLDFFPDEAPAEPSAASEWTSYLRAMRVRHLLSMSTGHAVDTTEPMTLGPYRSWVEGFLAQPVEYEPGTHFLYNSGASYMLSAIAHKLSGGRMLDYLRPRLFEPLGIADPRWETSPQGIDTGGWGLSATTADIAAFGQLYLQKGLWQGARILPEAWVEEATSRQVSNGSASDSDWEQGYGYQFWLCRHGAYRGDGAFGQYCIVMPEQDAVLAITSGLGDMQQPLNLVWEHLLPAMGPAPLPAGDEPEQAALTDKLGSLQLPTPQGEPGSPTAARVSGKRFSVAENEDQIAAITFDFGEDQTVIAMHNDLGEQRIVCGHGTWVRGEVSLGPLDRLVRMPSLQDRGPLKVGASGAWTDQTTYTAKLWWYETPFSRTLTCRFAGDHLTVEQAANVGFGPTERPTLECRLA
jgi:CubicO group peptidase (beta-lactamase class C family)